MKTVDTLINFLSLLVSFFSLLYAFRAATRSDKILKRLVVYPFRNLDFEFSKLTSNEQKILQQLFLLTKNDSGTIEKVSARLSLKDIEDLDLAIDLLKENQWISIIGGNISIKRDKIPYLNFVKEGAEND